MTVRHKQLDVELGEFYAIMEAEAHCRTMGDRAAANRLHTLLKKWVAAEWRGDRQVLCVVCDDLGCEHCPKVAA